jgi:hypothetical protein
VLNPVSVPPEDPERALTGTAGAPSSVAGRAARSVRALLRDPLLVVGLAIVATSLILIIVGPVMAPYDPLVPTPDV